MLEPGLLFFAIQKERIGTIERCFGSDATAEQHEEKELDISQD